MSEEKVYMWDIESGDLLATGRASLDRSILRFSPDAERLVVQGSSDHLSILDSGTLDELTTVPGYYAGWNADFSPDGLRLVTPLEGEDVLILDLAPVHELPTVALVDAGSSRFVLNHDHSLVASVDDFGQVSLRDASTGELIWQAQGHDDWSGAIDFSPEGAYLASGSDDGTMAIWDTETGEMLKKWTAMDSWVNRVSYNPDGSQLAAVGQDGSVKVYDQDTGEIILSLTHDNIVWGMAYNSAGELAIANGAHQTIDIWDPSTGEKLQVLDAPQFIVSIVFDPDGEWLAGGGQDSVIIYDMKTGETRFTLTALQGYIMNMSVNPDGSRLATGGVRVWDPDSGELLHSLPIGGSIMAFSPDGKHIILGDYRGTLRTITLDLEELTALARSRLTRELTESECAHYRIESCQSAPDTN
jgi:WD40 repeat protein